MCTLVMCMICLAIFHKFAVTSDSHLITCSVLYAFMKWPDSIDSAKCLMALSIKDASKQYSYMLSIEEPKMKPIF